MQNSLSRPLEKIFSKAFGHILSGGKIGFLRPAVEETYVNRKEEKTTRFSLVENPVDNVENSLLSTQKPTFWNSFPQGEKTGIFAFLWVILCRNVNYVAVLTGCIIGGFCRKS